MAGKAAFEAAESLSSYNDTTSEDSKLVQSTADSLDSSALAPAQLTAEWRSRRRPHEWRLQWLQCRLTSLALLSHAHDDLSEHCEHVLPDETLDEQLDQPSECTRTLPLHSRSHLRRRLLQHPPSITTTAPHPAAYSLSNHASEAGLPTRKRKRSLTVPTVEEGTDVDLSVPALWSQLTKVECVYGELRDRMSSHLRAAGRKGQSMKRIPSQPSLGRSTSNNKKLALLPHLSNVAPPPASMISPAGGTGSGSRSSSNNKAQIVTPGVREISRPPEDEANHDQAQNGSDHQKPKDDDDDGGDSSEDTRDEVFLRRHEPLQKQERERLQQPIGPSQQTRAQRHGGPSGASLTAGAPAADGQTSALQEAAAMSQQEVGARLEHSNSNSRPSRTRSDSGKYTVAIQRQ